MSTLRTIRDTRLVLGIVGLFFVSMIMSCQEMEYLVKGKTVNATLMDTHIEKDQEHGNDVEKRVVGYSFMDGTTFRHEYADVPVDWPGVHWSTVKVEYLPGWERHSRLKGQNKMMYVYIFVGSLVLAGLVVWNWMREG